jgi:hypothetical protein
LVRRLSPQTQLPSDVEALVRVAPDLPFENLNLLAENQNLGL